jgi:hypothetical protein
MGDAGLGDAATADGLGAVLAYVLGFVAFEHAAPQAPPELPGTGDRRVRRTLEWGRGDRDFRAGLRLILDGLAAR